MSTWAAGGKRRWFWGPVCLLLAWTTAARVSSALQENQTWDEAFHLAAGFSYLRTGDYRMRTENPPLGKLLAALPLLALKPRVPIEEASWQSRDVLGFGNHFMFRNRVPADTLLFAARSATILLSLVLGLVMAVWARRYFGAGAALLACALYALDPNLIAHGRYVTSDLPATLFIFLALVAWVRYLEAPGRMRLVVAGLALGLALGSKSTALALVPVLVALYLLRWWQKGAGLSLWRLVKSLFGTALVSAAVLAVLYAPDTLKLFTAPPPPLAGHIRQATLLGQVASSLAYKLHVPAHPYLLDLTDFLNHVQSGHQAYLLGQIRQYGWWYYFPVAMAVKTPTATLLLLLVAAGLAMKAAPWRRLVGWLRELPLKWFAVSIPPVMLLGAAMSAGHNLGLRHILPVYPFLIVGGAGTLLRPGATPQRLRAGLACGLVLLAAVECASIHPHYLAFFNFLAGGPGAGPRYLVDSNLDWGQDLKKLKRYLASQGTDQACLCYFGTAPRPDYGVTEERLPTTAEVREGGEPDCIAAISATSLMGVYVPEEDYRWLRERQPTAKVGYSIYVYDLRRKK